MRPFRLGFAPNSSVFPSNTYSTPFNIIKSMSSTMLFDWSLRVLRSSIPFISLRVSTSGAWSTRGISRLSILTPSSTSYYFNSYISSKRSDRRHCIAKGLFWNYRADSSEGTASDTNLPGLVVGLFDLADYSELSGVTVFRPRDDFLKDLVLVLL